MGFGLNQKAQVVFKQQSPYGFSSTSTWLSWCNVMWYKILGKPSWPFKKTRTDSAIRHLIRQNNLEKTYRSNLGWMKLNNS